MSLEMREVLMGKRTRTSLDLPEMLDKQVMLAAQAQGQTKAGYIRSCIVRSLEDRRQFGLEARYPNLGGRSK